MDRIDRFLRRLSPRQIAFISAVCRALLAANDQSPRAFRTVVRIVFAVLMVGLAVLFVWSAKFIASVAISLALGPNTLPVLTWLIWEISRLL